MPSIPRDLPAAWPPHYPPHRAVSGEESRALDREAEQAHGLPSLVLMEHASVGIAALAARLVGPAAHVVVVCGPGNNGGDGYGAARFLASWGRSVRLLSASRNPPAGPDAAREVALARQALPLEEVWGRPEAVAAAVARADLVIDALFGVGLARDLAPPYPAWIEALNASPGLRLAVDVPSGLDADTGEPRPVAVEAHVTATMAMPKRGLLRPEGRRYAGHVVEVDIGLPGPVHGRYLAPRPS